MNSLFRKVNVPIIVLPALVFAGATLLILLAAVTNAAGISRPGDSLYPSREPALRLQLAPPQGVKQHVQLENLLLETNARQAATALSRT